MEDENKIKLEIPRKLLHDKESEMFLSDNGGLFAWIDLSEILKMEGYGFYFPNWLISKQLEYCVLTIEKEYRSNYDGKVHKNVIKVEHKEKIKGKRFKRFTYSPEELIELMQVYSNQVEKIKKAAENKVLARVTEFTSPLSDPVTFYAIGYIRGKIFESQDIINFRSHYASLRNKKGGKRISADSFLLIAEGLTDEEVTEIRLLIEAKEIAEYELLELQKRSKFELPIPFDKSYFSVNEVTEYIVEIPFSFVHTSRIHKSIKGYPEKMKELSETIQSAYQDTINFLEEKISEIEKRLLNYRKQL